MTQALQTRSRFPFRLEQPSADDFDRAIRELEKTPFSYDPVGGTAKKLPIGWAHHDVGVELGHGEDVWQRARSAIRNWSHFDLGWVRFADPGTPIEEGQTVAFASNTLGFWTLNVCRIVYVLDEDDGERARFGFAYGTLDGHVVRGEELFLLTRDHATDCVEFRITKFSRPNHPLVKLFSPVARAIQHRFSVDALERLRAEVAS